MTWDEAFQWSREANPYIAFVALICLAFKVGPLAIQTWRAAWLGQREKNFIMRGVLVRVSLLGGYLAIGAFGSYTANAMNSPPNPASLALAIMNAVTIFAAVRWKTVQTIPYIEETQMSDVPDDQVEPEQDNEPIEDVLDDDEDDQGDLDDDTTTVEPVEGIEEPDMVPDNDEDPWLDEEVR